MPITLKAIPFDAKESIDSVSGQVTYDRLSYAKDIARYFGSFISNGVIVLGGNLIGDQLKVTNGGGLKVNIAIGSAAINGRVCWRDDSTEGLFVSAGASQDRVDRIVLELNTLVEERNVYIKVLAGTPASAPVPPSLTRTDDVYQLSLASVRVNANTNIISYVQDERMSDELCGIANMAVGIKPPTGNEATLIKLLDSTAALLDLFDSSNNVDNAFLAVLEWLGNLERSYAAANVSISNILSGGTPVGKAKDSEKLDGKLPSAFASTNHASTTSSYGVANSTNYGHVKLSDSVNSTSGASSNIASTPLAIKTVYDKIGTDVGNVFQLGDIRRSARDLSSLGYVKCFPNRTLPNASNVSLSNALKYMYGGKISNLTWRNNPVSQTSNVYTYNSNWVWCENGIIFMVLRTDYGNEAVYYSTDGGVTFAALTLPGTMRATDFNIKYLNGVYVTLSPISTSTSNRTIIYSTTNFVSWTQNYTIPSPAGNIGICSIDFIAGKYIMALSGNNTQSGFYYSTNLTNWTLAYNGNAEWYGDGNNWGKPQITAGSSIAITHWDGQNYTWPAGTSVYYTTTDGVTWTKRSISGFAFYNTSGSGSAYPNVCKWCSGFGVFVSLRVRRTDSAGFLWSSDGINWNPCTCLGMDSNSSIYIYKRREWAEDSNYGQEMFYNAVDNIMTITTGGNGYSYSFISKDGKNFSFIDTPAKMNNYSYKLDRVIPVNGKCCMMFRYIYSGENYTTAFGTANFPTCDYFYLPNDLFGDSWIKV